MRVSRTRFSKRRSKRRTSFPVIAIVQQKTKPKYNVLPSIFGQERDRKKLSGSQQNNLSKANQKEQGPAKKSRASIDYKNVVLLRKLITTEGKILPRRINKLTAKQQRHTAKAIKSARIMGLLPFINKSRPLL